ncbi:hypothetical protein M569_14479, partial [Genlisea aurea]
TRKNELSSERKEVNEEILLGKRRREMDDKKIALVIGIVGSAITLSAYSQTILSPEHCIGVGFVVLVFALLIREGIISL